MMCSCRRERWEIEVARRVESNLILAYVGHPSVAVSRWNFLCYQPHEGDQCLFQPGARSASSSAFRTSSASVFRFIFRSVRVLCGPPSLEAFFALPLFIYIRVQNLDLAQDLEIRPSGRVRLIRCDPSATTSLRCRKGQACAPFVCAVLR